MGSMCTRISAIRGLARLIASLTAENLSGNRDTCQSPQIERTTLADLCEILRNKEFFGDVLLFRFPPFCERQRRVLPVVVVHKLLVDADGLRWDDASVTVVA